MDLDDETRARLKGLTQATEKTREEIISTAVEELAREQGDQLLMRQGQQALLQEQGEVETGSIDTGLTDEDSEDN